MRGIECSHNHIPQRAASITPQMLSSVAAMINHNNSTNVVVFTAAIFLFLLMARAGNAFYSVNQGIAIGLKHKNVAFGQDCLHVTFQRTKTIKFEKQLLQIPLLAIPNSVVCPVSRTAV